MYKRLIRPILFSIDEEYSHAFSELALQIPAVWKPFGSIANIDDPAIATSVATVPLPYPVGIAAGFDKNCRMIPSLLNIGFGSVCGGTVTLNERPGNPKPRLIRIPEQNAIINSFGFPGQGLARIQPRIARLGPLTSSRTFVSISGSIEDEFAECYRSIAPLVAGIEVNISSPNSAGLRVFHDLARLRNLIEMLKKSLPKPRPILVKMPPWENETQQRRKALDMAETAINAGADGLVVANTIPVDDARLAVGKGGISGEPLLQNTERMTAEVAALVGKHASIVSCGGIAKAEHVWRMIAAGASSTQIYSAFIFEGPYLPARINRDLLKLMQKNGVKSISEINGPPPY